MFFRPVKLSAKSFFALLLIFSFAFISFEAQAQTKKNSKETAKKTTDKKKVDEKKSDKSTASKDKSKTTDKNSKSAKPSKAELAKQTEQKRLEEARKKEAAKREEAQRRENAERLAVARKAELARQQAALAEKRRREQAAREARERYLAFERGLKTETQANIANDDTEGEDMEVRRAAVNALGNRAGTVVVMEPQTGKVLSIVNQEWAIRRSFKPCSTIKLVTGVAGVNEKVIGTDGNIKTRRFSLNLDDALAHSNNSYFQVAGQNIGNERMISYAKALGLGEPTGINAENETAGKLPYGNNNARIYSHGDDFEVTPLQLSVMVSALSNNGKVVVPQIPKTRAEKANFRGYLKKQIELPQESYQRVLPGMIGAVNYGTAKRAADYSMNIAGKTGSCIGQGSWVGLFASVAPVVNPRLSVVVITRGSAERGKYASEIAGKIYKSLAYRFNDGKEYVAKVPLELKPKQQMTAKSSQQLDKAEGEDSDEGDVPKPQPKPTPKKIEEKKAVFESVIINVNREPTRPRIVPNKP
jgi:penicillin-binding protein 2